MRTHTHPCERCKAVFGCSGELLRNFDGWPEVICTLYHDGSAKYHQFRQCEECVMTEWCGDCGQHPVKTEIDGDRLCLTCADERSAHAAKRSA